MLNNLRKDEPKLPKVTAMPMPIKPHSKPDQIAPNHPAVAQHIAQFNDMAHELDRMRADRDRLANELEIERRVNAELQHTVDGERQLKEKYQRYAVKADTYFNTLATTAMQARDESQQAALAEPPKEIEPPITAEELEVGIGIVAAKLQAEKGEIAAKFAPKREGEQS